eukprot:3248319-Amphidinium_carterae.1
MRFLPFLSSTFHPVLSLPLFLLCSLPLVLLSSACCAVLGLAGIVAIRLQHRSNHRVGHLTASPPGGVRVHGCHLAASPPKGCSCAWMSSRSLPASGLHLLLILNIDLEPFFVVDFSFLSSNSCTAERRSHQRVNHTGCSQLTNVNGLSVVCGHQNHR